MTVRQIFSADPAVGEQAFSSGFGGGPFHFPKLPGNTEKLLMDAAPLSTFKSAIQFGRILASLVRCVNRGRAILSHIHKNDRAFLSQWANLIKIPA